MHKALPSLTSILKVLILLTIMTSCSSGGNEGGNNNGSITITEAEKDSTGLVTKIEETTLYSQNGKLTLKNDFDGNGEHDSSAVYHMNRNRKIVSIEYDHNNDGSIDSTTNFTYINGMYSSATVNGDLRQQCIYDDNGKVTSLMSVNGIDASSGELMYMTQSFSYKNNLLETYSNSLEPGRIYYFSYVDERLDGINIPNGARSNLVENFSFDEDNQIISYTVDWYEDGTSQYPESQLYTDDYIYNVTWDDNRIVNFLITQRGYPGCFECFQTLEEVREYDDTGKIVFSSKQTIYSQSTSYGPPMRLEKKNVIYNSGKPERIEFDTNGDDVCDYAVSFAYEKDTISSEITYSDCFGTLSNSIERTFSGDLSMLNRYKAILSFKTAGKIPMPITTSSLPFHPDYILSLSSAICSASNHALKGD